MITKSPPRLINPTNPLDAAGRERGRAWAQRQASANGMLMQVITYVGGQVEDGMKMLPAAFRTKIEGAARTALERSFHLAKASRQGPLERAVAGDRMHKVIGAISGALGGVGGVPTAIAEIPVATTIIFRAVQGVAQSYGEDIDSDETRAECLRVFSAGGPDADDDGIDTSFIGARVALTGPAIHSLIAKVAPKFAAVLTQKPATQAVPVLGAAAGAGTNLAFVNYYTEMAHVHFGLRQLAREFDPDQVIEAFHAETVKGRSVAKR